MKHLILYLFFSLSILTSFSQGSENAAVFTVNNQPNGLLTYLFDKYGIQESELILLKIRQYEVENKVVVLSQADYLARIERINAKISIETDVDKQNQLETEKLKIINFILIEEFILNN